MPKAYTDVPGCLPNTVKRSITTNRNLDPLNPSYVLPGHTEPNPGIDAYGPIGSSMGMKASALHALAAKVQDSIT